MILVLFQSAHGGSEPKIISTMAVDGFSSMSNHVSLFDNPNAENHLRELLQQHKSRKTDEPVSTSNFINFSTYFG